MNGKSRHVFGRNVSSNKLQNEISTTLNSKQTRMNAERQTEKASNYNVSAKNANAEQTRITLAQKEKEWRGGINVFIFRLTYLVHKQNLYDICGDRPYHAVLDEANSMVDDLAK